MKLDLLEKNWRMNYRNLDIMFKLKEELFNERIRIIFEDGHVAYYSKYPFYNQRYLDWLNENLIVNLSEGTYRYINEFNDALAIKRNDDGYYCYPNKERHPVCGVNWYGAKLVCSDFNGRLPYIEEMRFLTKLNLSRANINMGENVGETSSVEKYGADSLGLYDICGNISEWCEDTNINEKSEKAVFGVSWNNDYNGNLMHCRYKWSFLGAVSVGFRIVWEEE